LIFTKADKLSATKVQSNVAFFMNTVFAGRAEFPRIFTSSSKTKQGRLEILKFIDEMLAERK
jgi:GTP-binding protein